MIWQSYIKGYKNYLKLEKSLSDNSVMAYVRDIEKLSPVFRDEQIDKKPQRN